MPNPLPTRCLTTVCLTLAGLACGAVSARAERPSVAYMFPAGGQRGTTVNVRIGGYNLHQSAKFHLRGHGIETPQKIIRTKTVFFEGPVIPQPASQRKEDYPKDYKATMNIAPNASPGARVWRVSTSQGVTSAKTFVVGDLPEVVEREIDGAPLPTNVTLPVTINGRIFPREDVDVWTFDAEQGETLTCEVHAARLGSPLDSRIEVRGPGGTRIAENVDAVGSDSRLSFTAPQTGRYAVRIHDVNFKGHQSYVYRLTVTAGPYVTSVYPLGGRRGENVQLQLQGVNLPSKTYRVKLPAQVTGDTQGKGAGISVPGAPGSSQTPPLFRTRCGKSNRFALAVDDLPEYVETPERRDESPAPSNTVAIPAVVNGRIEQAGDVDEWTFSANKGDNLFLDVFAARLGSPLDSVLTVYNADGQQLATDDDRGKGETDSQLRLTIPADGDYTVRIAERFSSRGGPEFAYRLRITRSAGPAFRLTLPTDALSVDRGSAGKLKLNVERFGGFKGKIELKVKGLPKGVTVSGTTIGKNKRKARLTFNVADDAPLGVSELVITGQAEGAKHRRAGNVSDASMTQTVRAVCDLGPGGPVLDTLSFCVALPTPFKFVGEFETKYASRGSTYYRHYKLERNGYAGPLTVKLADIQARHLQGVQGPTITIPPGATEFDYPVSLAPWMEIGRTSRTCIMAVGQVTDDNGRQHTVSYSSTAQNDQILLLVDPGRLSIRCKERTIRLQPGKTVTLPVTIARGNGLAGPVRVELVVADHIEGVNAEAIVIPQGKRRGTLRLRFADGDCGPFNMPLVLRATLNGNSRHPHVDETLLTVVVNGQATPLSYYQSRR